MRIITSKKFEKQFSKLPLSTKKRALERFEIFKSDTHAEILDNHPLSGEWRRFRSINISGDYRAIFQKHEDGIYYFVEVGTHSQLYK